MVLVKQAPKKQVKVKIKKRQKPVNYGATQDIVNIKRIQDGFVETKDGQFIKILEIEPINFQMLSAEEQSNIIWSFASFLKIAPASLHFKVLSRKADANVHINQVISDVNYEKNRIRQIEKELPKLRDMIGKAKSNFELDTLQKKAANLHNEYEGLIQEVDSDAYLQRQQHANEYINKVRELSRSRAISRRFFLIYKYEARMGRQGTYEDVVAQVNDVAQKARIFLGKCGNHIVVHQTVEEENRFQAEIWYMLLNRKYSASVPFRDHTVDVLAKEMAERSLVFTGDYSNVPNDIPDADFVAPSHINLKHRDYIYIDGTYYSFVMFSGNGYPTQVQANWLDPVINFGDGIDVDIFAHRESKAKTLQSLRHRIGLNKSKIHSTDDTSNDYEDVEDALNSAYYIKGNISRGHADLYFMDVLVTVTAGSLKDMRRRYSNVLDLLHSLDIKTFNCAWRYEKAFLSSLPVADLDSSLYEMTKRNVLTGGLASTYMFTTYEMSDSNGIMLGVNALNSSMFIIDIFNTAVYMNANMCILGSSGGGKTFTLQMMAMRLRMRQIQCFIIAPDKGHEFRRACHKIGGTFIKLCAGSPYRINVMDIYPVNDESDIEIEGEGGAYVESLLSRKVQDLKIFFKLLIPEMTNVQEQLLDKALNETYKQKGITKDNNSIYEDADKAKLKEMPIISDLLNVISEVPELKSVADVIDGELVHGSADNFNGHTNVNLDNKYIVLDISDLKGNLKPVGMFMVLDYIWNKVKEDRTQKKAVFIDEAWRLISENKYAAEYVKELFKEIRGYGGAAIAATQDLIDFFALEDGKYGKALINNSAINIIKFLQPSEAAIVRKVMNLTENQYKATMRFDKTQGLFRANNNCVEVEFVPTEFEKWLITTDRKELNRLKKNGYVESLLSGENKVQQRATQFRS